MNTISAIAALLALIWLTLWAFNDLGETALGYAGLGLVFAWFVAIFIAISEDVGDWKETGLFRSRRHER